MTFRKLLLLAFFLFFPTLGACHNEELTNTEIPVNYCQAVAFMPAVGGQAYVRFTDQKLPDIVMRDTNGDNVLEAVLENEPGNYNYLIIQNGKPALDPFNTKSAFSPAYDREVSLMTIPNCHQPRLELTSLVVNNNGRLWFTGQWYRADSLEEPDHASLTLQIDDIPPSILPLGENGIFSVEIENLPRGKHHLYLNGRDTAGNKAPTKHAVFWVEDKPFSWQDSNIYQVVVDRFAAADGSALPGTEHITYYHGGHLRGVIKKLEEGYFDKLAVNVIWLSPLYENPEGRFLGSNGFYSEPYHGYWPQDMRRLEERFGTEEDLRTLVKKAHQKGIRIILDSVFNHVHIQNHYFTDHKEDDWFNNVDTDCICGHSCDWGLHTLDCWFDPFLADFSWKNEDQIAAVIADHLYWLRQFDLDGLRMDAVPMMPRLAMRRFRTAIENEYDPAGEHIYLLGENYTNRGDQASIRYFLGTHTLSGLFDFPVMWALRQAVTREISLIDLNNEIERSERSWEGSGAVMGMFLGNHDIPRFISVANNDEVWQPYAIQPDYPEDSRPYERLRLGWSILYTLPGAPVIYYGDEVAIPGANDPDNRRDMVFDNLSEQAEATLKTVQQMASLRKNCPVLRRGERYTIAVTATSYVYLRSYNSQLIIVAINMDTQPAKLTFEIPRQYQPQVPALFTDLLSGETINLSSSIMHLNIDQEAIKVLALSGSCGE